MASRISQMRNGMQPYPQTPQMVQQQQLNESIERTRALMQQMQKMQNPQAAIMNLLQNNPQLQALMPMIRNGNSLENIAKQIAQMGGYDLNTIIRGLQNT